MSQTQPTTQADSQGSVIGLLRAQSTEGVMGILRGTHGSMPSHIDSAPNSEEDEDEDSDPPPQLHPPFRAPSAQVQHQFVLPSPVTTSNQMPSQISNLNSQHECKPMFSPGSFLKSPAIHAKQNNLKRKVSALESLDHIGTSEKKK